MSCCSGRLDLGRRDWVSAEITFLQKVPDLLGAGDINRHRDFWEHDRTQYLDWIAQEGGEFPMVLLRTYYEPIWNEMEPIMKQLFEKES